MIGFNAIEMFKRDSLSVNVIVTTCLVRQWRPHNDSKYCVVTLVHTLLQKNMGSSA